MRSGIFYLKFLKAFEDLGAEPFNSDPFSSEVFRTGYHSFIELFSRSISAIRFFGSI